MKFICNFICNFIYDSYLHRAEEGWREVLVARWATAAVSESKIAGSRGFRVQGAFRGFAVSRSEEGVTCIGTTELSVFLSPCRTCTPVTPRGSPEGHLSERCLQWLQRH